MRNLGLVVAIWLAALLPTNGLALGLGEITVNSFLNQPLNAEIEVISARAGEIDDLLVSLASRDAFTRAGLARPRHLSDLRFTVKKNEEGDQATIIVSTKAGVKEPFLNFLIEADWSKGRVLREFTILLDPPFYADQPPPAESAAPQPAAEDTGVSEIAEHSGVTPIAQAEPAAGAEQTTEPIAESEDTYTTPPSSSEYVADESQNIIEGDVLVVKGDTLWGIAARYKDDDHSMAQVMLAFQRTNQDAFANGNINNMKEGAILRAPGADEIDALGKQEAYAQVLEQNGLWDEYVARVTGVAPAVAAEGADQDSGQDEDASGELSLLLPGEGDSGATGAGDVDEILTKLAIAEEELDASRVENRELETRISELQARLSKLEELQKMVEIEDDSLAQMQAEQAQKIEELAAQVDEEELLEELLAEEVAAQIEEQTAGDDTVSDEAISEEVEESDAATTDDGMAEDETTEEAAPETGITTVAPPAPVIVTEPVKREPSILDGILPPNIIDMIPSMPSLGGLFADPIVLGAIAGIVILLLVLVVLKGRRGASDEAPGISASDDDDLFAGEFEEELTPIHLADGEDSDETDIKVPTEDDLVETGLDEISDESESEPVDDFASTAIISAEDMPEAEAPAEPEPEQDDVLNEVDVYLAYGLYDNAEELLSSSLVENPDRADYRSKLLDTHFATKDVDSFVREAEKLKSMGDAASRYWDRVQVMGYELAPENALFSDARDSDLSAADLEIAKPQEADFDLGASEDDDTNFSSTDFNLGEEDTGSFAATTTIGDADDVAATQQIPQIDDLPSLGDDDDTNFRIEDISESGLDLDLPDEIGVESKEVAGEDIEDDFNLDFEEPADDDSEEGFGVDLGGEDGEDFALDLGDEVSDDDLEFSMDEEIDVGDDDGDPMLPDDLDLGVDEEVKADDKAELKPAVDIDMDDIAMEFDIGDDEAAAVDDEAEVDFSAEFEAALEEAADEDFDESELIPFDGDLEDEEIEISIEPDEDSVEIGSTPESDAASVDTSIVTPNYEDTKSVPVTEGKSVDSDLEIDLGMEDIALGIGDETEFETDESIFGADDLNLGTSEVQLPTDNIEIDDDADISIIDFAGDDFVETADIDESIADLDDALVMDVDIEEGDAVKTGTFAPGDFDQPTSETLADLDDISELMLPDDVDEVSTKLDLARAFIDMGDTEGARGSLEEVISEGNEEQKAEARALLDQT